MKRLLSHCLLWLSLSVTPLLWAAEPIPIGWNDLVPEDYQPEKLVAKYAKELEKLNNLPDGDPEGMEIMGRINADMNSAPMNPSVDGQFIKLTGFIAPLDIHNGEITRFLLVPYFGACIHVPPPPLNQTIMVTTAKNQAVKMEAVDFPVDIVGKIVVKNAISDIGNAGYRIEQANTRINKDENWKPYP